MPQFRNNPEEANAPQASGSTGTSALTAIGAATSVLFWGGSSAVMADEGYYLIIQNQGTVNLEIRFGAATTGIVLPALSTFEVALSQGAEVYVANTGGAAGQAVAVLFA